jgi:hypothetical protein
MARQQTDLLGAETGRGPALRDLIPDHFDAYLRILFPIFEPRGDKAHLEQLSTWHETAVRSGHRPHRLMGLVGIGPDHDDGLHGGTQVPQTLASTQESALFSILQNHTASARSWFVLWYGDYHGSVVIPEQSLIEVDQGPSSPVLRVHWTAPGLEGLLELPAMVVARRPIVVLADRARPRHDQLRLPRRLQRVRGGDLRQHGDRSRGRPPRRSRLRHGHHQPTGSQIDARTDYRATEAIGRSHFRASEKPVLFKASLRGRASERLLCGGVRGWR